MPAGQLDLSAEPSADEPAHYRSYRDLLFADQELALAADDTAVGRERECTTLDDEGNALTSVEQVLVSAPAQAGSANGSSRFFRCFEGGDCITPQGAALPDNCVEGEGEPVAATRNTVNHTGLLSGQELHLLSEWLDIGGQYYNNPFDDRLVD